MKWNKMFRKFAISLVAIILITTYDVIPVKAYTHDVLTYTVSDGEITITDCDTTASGSLEIPRELQGYPVTSIGEFAFYNCTNLVSISIPSSVTNIGRYAFDLCEGLKTINIPTGVTSIAYGVFAHCSSLTRITIPSSVTSIEDYGFYNCNSLVRVSIPRKITSIGASAFAHCSSLTQISIPESVTSIGASAFENCVGLSNVVIPLGVTSVEEATFAGCENLTRVSIPSSVTSIGESAFSNCKSLSTVSLPEGVTIIEGGAFANCSNLKNANIPEGTTSIAPTAFLFCPNVTLHVKTLYAKNYAVSQEVPYSVTFKSIGVKKLPNKMEYCRNEIFNSEGFVLEAVFYDELSEEIAKGYQFSGFDSSRAGTCVITVEYEAYQTSFEVQIYENHEYDDGMDEFCNRCSYDRNSVTGGKDTVYRIYGTTRYQTAFKSADALKEKLDIEKFDTIIIANGNDFADALSGSYLAAVKNAPILMMDGTNITDVCNYINGNLNASGTVYLLGGVQVLPTTLENTLATYNVKRLSGVTRYETNLAILQEAGVDNADILVCTGTGFADSLSASATKTPILLVGDRLTAKQREFLAEISVNKFYVIGGVNAVSTGIEAEIQSYGATQRIGGATRFQTSVMIAGRFFNKPQSAVIAYAYNFPDGLSGGPLAMSMDAPLILSAPGSESSASAYMKKNHIVTGAVLGGPILISDNTVKKIYNLDETVSIIER